VRAISMPLGSGRLRSIFAAALIVAISACGGGGDDGSTAPAEPDTTAPASVSEATNFQIDASHTGAAPVATPTFPLRPAWQRTFVGSVSYPVIAAGKVFVIVAAFGFSGPTQLVAVDQATGLDAWPPVALGTSYSAAHAYDQGRIFVMASDGILRSFDAATGAPRWSTLLSFYQGGPPAARDGMVYVVAGNSMYAVDGRSGAIQWQTGANVQTAPSLGATNVLASTYCEPFALLQATGLEQWRVAAPATCSFAQPLLMVQFGGRAYLRGFDSGVSRPTLVVRDAATGALLGGASLFGFGPPPVPAINAEGVFVLNSGTLQRLDATLQTVSWSFAGDGTLASAPLLMGGVVVIGGYSGRLYALDSSTGAERWSTLVPAGVSAPIEYGGTVTTGMAAANGLLVVPADRTLSAWKLTP
jgi:outer membrane protein assembly factor BamB